MRRIPRPSPAMVVALIGVAIGLSGVAFATIPDSNGTIHGCYGPQGNLRVVETAGDCRTSEKPLNWSQGTEVGIAARAYARVLRNGIFDPARSRNIVGVTRPPQFSGRLACVELGFTPVAATATSEADPFAPREIINSKVSLEPTLVGNGCPNSDPNRTVLVDSGEAFYVVIW